MIHAQQQREEFLLSEGKDDGFGWCCGEIVVGGCFLLSSI